MSYKAIKNMQNDIQRAMCQQDIIWPDKEFAEYYLNAASLNLKIEASTRQAGIYEDGYRGDGPNSGHFTGNYPYSIPGYPDVEISYGKIYEREAWRSASGIAYNQYLPVTLRLKGTNYVIKKTCATMYVEAKYEW